VSREELPADLPQALDAVHVKVRDAFARADLADYGRYLAPDLRYVDARGRVQTREQLLRSVGVQFARLVSFDSAFTRETLLMNGEDAVESGTQEAAISLRLFVWFEVRWKVARRGRYTWRRATDVAWQLREAVLETEDIRRAGFGLAGRSSDRRVPV
jgi:uncharacterized protein DUF4440